MAQVGGTRLGVVPGLVLGVLGLTVAAVWAASGAAGAPSARGPGILPLPTTSTTAPGSGATTTSSSMPPPSTTSTTSTTVPPAGDYANPLVGVIPPDALAQIAAFHPTPPGSTAPLVAALAPLTSLGLTPQQAAIIGFGRFPVAGKAIWSDDFLDPRFAADGSFRFHHATDIPASCGTPLRAPDEGTLTQGSDPGGGTTAEITEADGTYVFLAHLSGYDPSTVSGQHVRIGDVIGYVGQTGAATGCHLHIEIHPRGGEAVDPKPFLDAWYQNALANASLLVDELRVDRGLPAGATTPVLSSFPALF